MSLCLGCGFCCDGTLFNRVPLLEGEVESLRAELGVAQGAHHGNQPCRALKGTHCVVYERRPLACRRYRCLLLEAHEAGEVSENDAQAIVDSAKRLRRELAAALGQDDLPLMVDELRRNPTACTGRAAELFQRLEHTLTFHFLGQSARRR